MPGTLPRREDIPDQYKWDLTAMYPDEAAWEAEMQCIPPLFEEFSRYEGRLNDSASTLLEALALHEKLGRRTDLLWQYAARRRDEDMSDSAGQARFGRAEQLRTELDTASSFFKPELMLLPEATLKQFMQEEPDLRTYAHFFEEIHRERPHMLPPGEERLLAQVGEMAKSPQTIHSMLTDADMTFGTIQDEQGNEVSVTLGAYHKLIRGSDARVRRDVFNTFFSEYQAHRNTLAATYAANVKKSIFLARARKHPSALAASLHPTNILPSVYSNLIETVHDHLPLLHRYLALKKRVLGLDAIHMYDINAPLNDYAGGGIAYDDAVQTVLSALEPLGAQYVQDARMVFASRWVDVYQTPNKRGGAHSAGCYDSPPYIMLNYADTLLGTLTIAHELGHTMHTYYTNRTQPYVYAYYSDFVAETASTVNEALLTHHLLTTSEDVKVQLAILNAQLSGFIGALFRQTMLGEFEKLAHEAAERGESLTADSMSAIHYDLNKLYYGPHVVHDELIAIEWAFMPHFYLNFMVYQYATGIAAATALSQQIISEGEPAAERYRRFLSSGNSLYSIDALREAGVDMSSPAPIVQAMGVFKQRLEELESLLKSEA